MDNSTLIKINASVVSCIGSVPTTNENNFYINGRFMFSHETDNVQVSIESMKPEFIFAITDNMDRDFPDKNSSISAVKEIKKIHQAVAGNKDIVSVAKQIGDTVDEVSNLLYSASLGNVEEKIKKPSLACLFLSEGKAVVLNMGSSRVYLYRGGSLKQLTNDYKKAERLLKSGIISREQTEELIRHLETSGNGGKTSAKKSDVIQLKPGDTFLICSNGLTNLVSDEKLSQIISSSYETEVISNSLVKEAYINGESDNTTAMIIRVDKTGSDYVEEIIEEPRRFQSSVPKPVTIPPRASSRRKRILNRFISTIAACLVIFGMVYGGYKLLVNASRVDQTGHENENSYTDQTKSTDEDQSQDIIVDENGGQDIEEPQGSDTPNESVEPGNDNGGGEGGSGTDSDGNIIYKVKEGDTLQKISLEFYGDRNKYEIIMKANELKNPNQLKINEELIIPKN